MERVGADRAFEERKPMASPTPSSPLLLPMASEAIAWIASALRLADVRAGNGAVSEATAKRLASASASVSDVKTAALLNNLVDALFPDAYLRARGLDEQQAIDHRSVLMAGIEGGLLVWDRLASLANSTNPERRAITMQVLGIALLGDLSARIGAYFALYGRFIPALRRLLDPHRSLSVAETLLRIRARARSKISDADLLRASKIERNTLRDLVRGQRLPREETILALARGLASLGIREADEQDATSHDLEFELRFASLFGRLHEELAADPCLHEAVASQAGTLRFYVSDLRRYAAAELAAIITCGTQWPRWWSEVHARLSVVLKGELYRMVNTMEMNAARRAEQIQQQSAGDPAAYFRLVAEDSRGLAAQTRESLSQIPGWERSSAGDMFNFHEQAAELWSALAGDTEPSGFAPLGDAFRAKCLCENAMAPWNNFTREKKDELYQAAVELDPACAYVRFQYATFLLEDNGAVTEAVRHLDVTVMLDDNYDEARLLLAEALIQAGNCMEALRQIDTLEERLGATAQVMTLRGYALLGIGQATPAADAFARALDIAPRDVACHQGRARALRALGEVARARKHEQSAALFAGQRSPKSIVVPR